MRSLLILLLAFASVLVLSLMAFDHASYLFVILTPIKPVHVHSTNHASYFPVEDRHLDYSDFYHYEHY